MANELDDAFQELLDAKTQVIGKEEFVILNGRKKAALVSEINAVDAMIAGGIAQEGGFTVTIAQSILPNEPQKFTPIECRGKKMVVMDSNDRNGVTWEITAGDPSSEAQ